MTKNITLSITASLLLAQNIYANDVQSLDVVTVTAQKTEENVQDVPISMTVFDELSIEEKRIKSVEDIAQYTPNLMFISMNGAPNSSSSTSRGLNTEEGSFSSSIGLFIDGIPVMGTSGFDLALTDIERIEVLKGPQGTLYGRGTIGGVINIITKKPDNETKTQMGLELGSDNKREYSFSVSGPIIEDKLYIGISGKHYEKDGVIKNTYLGGYTDDREYNYGKINLRYTPTDNLDISLISSILKYEEAGMSMNYKDSPRENSSNEGSATPKTLLNALKVEYDFDKYKFESITTHKNVKENQFRDWDFTSAVGSHLELENESTNYSQEFRLSSSIGDLQWLVGLNMDKDEHIADYVSLPSNYKVYNELNGEAYGIFTHLTYDLMENLSIIGGLRYDKNEFDFTEESSNTDLSTSYSEISPKIGVEYDLNNNSMIYATVSKGYRPGGFYSYAAAGYSEIYDKETLWSYEIGSKNSFLDNRLILNTALYYMAIDDMQVEISLGGGLGYKGNAAKATSKGLEFDLSYRATDNLELFTSFGYNDTKFDEYSDASGDYSGNTNILAPEYNYNIGFQYRASQGYYARVDVNGYGETYLNKANTEKRDPYNIVNTKIGYETEDYDIYLYVDNLFDKEYDANGIYSYYTTYSPPREIGIQLAYRF